MGCIQRRLWSGFRWDGIRVRYISYSGHRAWIGFLWRHSPSGRQACHSPGKGWRVFIGALGLEIKIDAGIIQSFTCNLDTKELSIRLGQSQGGLRVDSVIVWTSQTQGVTRPRVQVLLDGNEAEAKRGGKVVPMVSNSVMIQMV